MSEGEGLGSHAPQAVAAARRLAEQLKLDAAGIDVLHSSNNTIVHLPGCELVAKVGTGAGADETLARELAIAVHLMTRGADIAPPAKLVAPGPYRIDDLSITLWEFLPHDPDPELNDDQLADSLERLHAHLHTWDGPLPDYRDRILRTKELLSDDDAMRAVPRHGLELLRRRLSEVGPALLERIGPTITLHGGPHSRNVLITAAGLRWIDFETCCHGPLEADLAYLGDVGTRRSGVDLELLAAAKLMLSLCVATACWVRPDRHPRLREAAEFHLAVLADQPGPLQ